MTTDSITPTVGQDYSTVELNENPTASAVLGCFRGTLLECSIDILGFGFTEDQTVLIDYRPCSDTDEQAIRSEIGIVLKACVEASRLTTQTVDISPDVFVRAWYSDEDDGEVAGVSYWIRAKWIQAFLDGSMSQDEIATKLRGSLENLSE